MVVRWLPKVCFKLRLSNILTQGKISPAADNLPWPPLDISRMTYTFSQPERLVSVSFLDSGKSSSGKVICPHPRVPPLNHVSLQFQRLHSSSVDEKVVPSNDLLIQTLLNLHEGGQEIWNGYCTSAEQTTVVYIYMIISLDFRKKSQTVAVYNFHPAMSFMLEM